MPIIDYPGWLPLAQKASKNMTLDTGFQTDQPAVGPTIFQNQTDDLKVTWSLTWIFTLAQDRAFPAMVAQSRTIFNRRPELVPDADINLGGSGLQVAGASLHARWFPVQTSIDWRGGDLDGNRYCQPPVQRRRRV